MTIDMKYFNVYYFCHLANESMGKFEYATNYGIFVEQEFAVDPEAVSYTHLDVYKRQAYGSKEFSDEGILHGSED